MFYQDDTLPNIEGEKTIIKAIYVLATAALSDGHAARRTQGHVITKGNGLPT